MPWNLANLLSWLITLIANLLSGGIGDVLFLYRGIDIDYRFIRQSTVQCNTHLENTFEAVFTNALEELN